MILSLPWERGVLGAMVSGTGFPGDVMREPLPVRLLLSPAPPVAEAPAAPSAAPVPRVPEAPAPKRQISHGPVRKSDGLAPVLHDQQVREAAIEKWVMIELAAHRHSQVRADTTPPEQVRQAVTDILEVKQPATMNKRAGAIGLYLSWARRCGYDPFPFTEQKAVEYLGEAIRESPCRATAFLEAVAFSGGMFGLAGADVALTARTRGLAARGLKRKRPKRQRAPFKASQLS